MVNIVDIQAQQDIYQDRIREIEHDRLVRLAQAGNRKGSGRLGYVLCWIGDRLVGWGQCLQARYGYATLARSLTVQMAGRRACGLEVTPEA